MPIKIINSKLMLGKIEIVLQNRFNLILGKFKKDLIKKDNFYSNFLDNLNLITLDDISILLNDNEAYTNIVKANNIIEYLNEYNKKIKLNLELISDFNEIIEAILQIFKFIQLKLKKDKLLRELEISERLTEISDYKAVSDLLNKLTRAIKINKGKLKYIQEDYNKRKNQMQQLEENRKEFELKIQELNQFKKNCFNQINKITRNMEAGQQETNEKLEALGISVNLSNSEKIRALQQKARDSQYEINKLKLNLEEVILKIDTEIPEYKQYENDYQEIVNTISKDESKKQKLENDLKEKAPVSIEFDSLQNFSIKPIGIIKEELDQISSNLKQFSIPETYFSVQKPQDMSKAINEIKNITKNFKYNENKLLIELNLNKIIESIDSFNKFKNFSQEINSILNIFLSEINLKSKIQLNLDEYKKKFYLKVLFQRTNEDEISFENLTTPEKVFVITTFMISIKILSKTEHIIFTNLQIPSKYNKRGSIFRTIRKIIPLFESNEKLINFNLVFILSNLEMKKEIKNLKIIKIEES
jgi:hypothetical protein